MMIEIICPSRGRPEIVKRMADSALKTAMGCVGVAIGIDADDPKKDEYLAIKHPDIRIEVYERNGVTGNVPVVNALAVSSTAHYLLFVGDDSIFRTPNWDKLMSEKMPIDDIGIVASNNGNDNMKGSFHFMVSKKWIDTLGWFFPSGLLHYYADPYVEKIGRKLGRVFLSEAVVDHLHWERNKEEHLDHDETYKRNEVNAHKDRETYGKLIRAKEFAESVEKLRGQMRV